MRDMHLKTQPETSRTRTSWRKNLFLLLATLAIAFGTAEGVVRLLFKDRVVLFPRWHSRAVYGDYTLRRLRPNSEFWHRSVDGRWKFVTNAQGFRNTSDFSYEKVPGRLRVLSIGDSHTQGFEVRQEFTYSSVLERWLKSHGTDVEVINAGVSGFGTAEGIVFLEQEGVRYQPDVVIYGMFDNDYEDNSRSGLFELVHDTLVTSKKGYAPAVGILDVINDIALVRWLSDHSYLYSIAFNTVWDRYKALSVAQARRTTTAEYAVAQTAPEERQTSPMAALLKRLGAFCRSRGILLIIMDIPAGGESGVGEFRTSILPSVRSAAEQAADVMLFSDEVLGPFRGTAELHVPHGQHHISEFSHTLLGVHAGHAILNAQRSCNGPASRLALCGAGRSYQAGIALTENRQRIESK
jgi:hypothetical protein